MPQKSRNDKATSGRDPVSDAALQRRHHARKVMFTLKENSGDVLVAKRDGTGALAACRNTLEIAAPIIGTRLPFCP